MLLEFLKSNRSELISRCQAKAIRRAGRDKPVPDLNDTGVPELIGQLIETFRLEQTPEARARVKAAGHKQPSLTLVPTSVARGGAEHGVYLLGEGVTIDQVVHGYGDLCQSLTELALEKNAPITVDEFHTFNRLLDDAIAGAVAAFTGEPNATVPQAVAVPSVASGSPVEAMHGLISRALHTFSAIKRGDVGLSGTTAMLHEQTLNDLHHLLDRALARDKGGPDRPPRAETPGIKGRHP